MKSYIAKPNEVERKWYVIDAAGKPLGRVASQVATILRGKNKPTYTSRWIKRNSLQRSYGKEA